MKLDLILCHCIQNKSEHNLEKQYFTIKPVEIPAHLNSGSCPRFWPNLRKATPPGFYMWCSLAHTLVQSGLLLLLFVCWQKYQVDKQDFTMSNVLLWHVPKEIWEVG